MKDNSRNLKSHVLFAFGQAAFSDVLFLLMRYFVYKGAIFWLAHQSGQVRKEAAEPCFRYNLLQRAGKRIFAQSFTRL